MYSTSFPLRAGEIVTGRSEQNKHWFMSCVQHACEVSFHTSALPWYITCWDCVKKKALRSRFIKFLLFNRHTLPLLCRTGRLELLYAWQEANKMSTRVVDASLDTSASVCGRPDVSWAQAVSWEVDHGWSPHPHSSSMATVAMALTSSRSMSSGLLSGNFLRGRLRGTTTT